MAFPALYHTHHNLDNEDLHFWLRIANLHPGPILELGCGTGRILLPLWEAGHDISGLDIDRTMLNYLISQCQQRKLKIPKIIQASCANFRINTKFSAIIMPCNTFSTLSSTDQKATLNCVKNHLKPDGIFVFSIPNPEWIKQLPSESDPEVEDFFTHPIDGEPVQVSSSWSSTESKFTLWWDYDHLLPDGHVKRTRIEIIHHLKTIDSYLNELEENHLHLINIFGDYDQSKYRNKSPHLIIQAGLD